MAEKKLYMGSVGPYLFDDTDLIDDADGNFAGETCHAFASDRQILITETPTESNHLTRLGDIELLINKTNAYNFYLGLL